MDILHEILKEVKEIAIDQAALREKVEFHLQNTEKIEEELTEWKAYIPKIERHDIFMKISVWVYIFVVSTLGVKLFSGKFPF